MTYYDSYTWVYDNAPKGNSKKYSEKCYFCYFFVVTCM